MSDLFKINDILNESFIRLPMTLIANPRYRGLSSDAKILYALLCNRLTLSQRNNWVNDRGEVYLIYTRKQAAEALGLSYKTIIKNFKALIDIDLIVEERRGKSLANHIYIRKTESCDIKQAVDWNEAADVRHESGAEDCRSENNTPAQTPVICKNYTSPPADYQNGHSLQKSDMSNLHIMTCKNYSSEPVKSTVLDMSNLHPSKKEIIYKDLSEIEKSQSVSRAKNRIGLINHGSEINLTDRRTFTRRNDQDLLDDILCQCELENFSDDIANNFRTAIERLFYSEVYKIGNAMIPQIKLRSYLDQLDYDLLLCIHHAICRNTTMVKNKIGYLMTLIINSICERDIELYIFNKKIE